MEFPFNASKVLSADQNDFVIVDAGSSSVRSASVSTTVYNRGPSITGQGSTASSLAQVLDKMGEASSRAQGLGQVITTYSKFISSGDNRIYIKVEGNLVCGILKVGKKNLFYYDGFGGVKELRPLCVLDFYVHESMQRQGVGKILFEMMLEKEGIAPEKLAYDRPSIKFISFLKKHYGLAKYTPQNNNFVIFNQYWDNVQKVTKPKEQDLGSIQEYRDKKFSANKVAVQTDFQKTGKSIIESGNKVAVNNEMSKPPQPPKTNQNSDNSKYPVKDTEENKTRSRFEFLEKEKRVSFQGFEQQVKAADEAFVKQKGKTDSLDLGKGKPQVWNVSANKPQTNYTTTAPWGSYGTDLNSYKTSSAYGSYYSSSKKR